MRKSALAPLWKGLVLIAALVCVHHLKALSCAAEIAADAQSERVRSLVLKFENNQLSTEDFVVSLQAAASRELGDEGFAFEEWELRNVIGDALVKKTKFVLLNKSSSAALDLKKAARAILGPRHADTKRVDRLVYVSERAEMLEASQDAVRMDRFSEEVTDDTESTIVSRRKSTMFHRMAQDANLSGSPTLAVRYLSEIEKQYWRDSTPELLLRSIELVAQKVRVNPNFLNHWPFDEANVKSAIAYLESKQLSEQQRSKLHEALAEIYSYRTLYSLERSATDLARDYYQKVLKYRPDPNERNNQLRFDSALSASGPEARSFAQQRINELYALGGMTMSYRVNLLMSGYYGGFFPVVFYATLLLCACIILLGLFKPGAIMFRRASGAARVRQARVRGAGYMHAPQATDEYSRLLALFGLDDGASKDDIKRAYRQLAKNYHPDRMQDRSPEEQAEATERFDELKRAYDRILEFQQSQFGSFSGE